MTLKQQTRGYFEYLNLNSKSNEVPSLTNPFKRNSFYLKFMRYEIRIKNDEPWHFQQKSKSMSEAKRQFQQL